MPLPGIATERYDDLAEALGISKASVWDIASYDDEAATTLSMLQIRRLSQLTDLSMPTILGIDAPRQGECVALDSNAFCAAIRRNIDETGISVEDFEEKIGWEVKGILADPRTLYETAGWECIEAIASELRLDPRSALPTTIETSERDPGGKRDQRR